MEKLASETEVKSSDGSAGVSSGGDSSSNFEL